MVRLLFLAPPYNAGNARNVWNAWNAWNACCRRSRRSLVIHRFGKEKRRVIHRFQRFGSSLSWMSALWPRLGGNGKYNAFGGTMRRTLLVDDDIDGFYFAHMGNDPLSQLAIRHNKEMVQAWLGIDVDPSDDFDTASKSVAVRLGASVTAVRSILLVVFMLRSFSKLRELVLATGCLDDKRLIAIERHLVGVKPEMRAAVEADLVDMLTPKMPAQVLPQARTLGKRVAEIVEKHDPAAIPPPEPKKGKSSMRQLPDGRYRLSLTMPALRGALVAKRIQAAMGKGGDAFEAAMSLLEGKKEPQVTLNTYEVDGAVYAEGAGKLDPETAERLRALARQVTVTGEESTTRHDPTPALKAFVRARDGHCRFPGCEVEAHKCQIDHVTPYDAGGRTHASNLHLLRGGI